MSKKGWIVGGVMGVVTVVVAVALLLGVIFLILMWSSHNSLVNKELAVESAQADIQTQLQRRADLIPNFVETVKGYTDYEQSTLQAVTDARAAVGRAEGNAEEQAEASAQLDGAISLWVNAVTEAYPELKANEQFRALQDELAGTENRVAVARKDYNDAVKEYNAAVRRFPMNIFAGMFGFEQAEFFEADADAQDVPQVSFDD